MESSKKSCDFYFPAGQMVQKDKKLHANPERGVLKFFISNDTQMLSLKWDNIEKKTSTDEIIITPGDYIYKKLTSSKGSPFSIENSSYSDDKYYFYYQTKNKEKIEKYEKTIIEILEKGQLPNEESEKNDKTVPMSIEEVNNNKDNKGTNQNQFNANIFSEILKSIKKQPHLGKILTTEKIKKLFQELDEETKKRLIQLLPENQRTEQGFYDNINSPQFKHGLVSFSAALDPENLPAVISSFGLDNNVAQKYYGIEAFIRAIIAKYPPKEDKKEEKEKNKEDKK